MSNCTWKIFFILLFHFLVSNTAFAQYSSDRKTIHSEIGFSLGVSHYFGDLNNQFLSIDHPKEAFGIFYRYNINEYLSSRLSIHYAKLYYDDAFNSNVYEKRRNLNFATDLYEISLHGDFNFYEFLPANKNYFFTLYTSVGIGGFYYNPYSYLNQKKYYLNELGTEGELLNGGKPYGNYAICFPLALGMKFNVSEKLNMGIEFGYRLTNTDYLDDVSGNYVGRDKFVDGSIAQSMQDKSDLTGSLIGTVGRQRGDNSNTDSYYFFEFLFSFNIINHELCPKDSQIKF